MKVIALTALAATAGLAVANPISVGQFAGTTVDNAGTPTTTIVVDISGLNSWDLAGAIDNEFLSVGLAVGAQVTGLGWDVTLSTFGGSWASEAVLSFEGQINLTVGNGDDFAVTNAAYASDGILDLSDLGLDNITLGGDGTLDVEAFESFDDAAGAIDATYGAGSTLTFAVVGIPTPGSLAVLGLGGLVAGRRRR